MKRRFGLPLYAQALVLLAVNLLMLAALFFAGGGWGSLLSGAARERVASLGEKIRAEFSAAPESQWTAILDRYSAQQGVSFTTSGLKRPPGAGPGGPPPSFREGGGPPGFPGPDDDRSREGSPPPMGPPPGFEGGFDRGFPPGQTRPPSGVPGAGPLPAGMTGSDGSSRGGPPPNLGGRNDRLQLTRETWRGPYRIFVPGAVQTDRGSHPLDIVVSSPSLIAMARFLGVSEWVRFALVAAGLSMLLWVPFMVAVARAVTRLRDATQRIAEGRFDVRVPDARGDELGQLADSVNDMAARLERQVNGQKLFLADVAHETISPLARMQVGLGLLETRVDAPGAEILRDVQDDVRQMSELLHELLLFSRAGAQAERAALEPVDLAAAMREALGREDIADARVQAADGLKVLSHPALLLRALCNLVRNASRHGAGSPIELSAERRGERIYAWVRDRGPGVREAALARLGEPFFRPDESRSRDSGGYGLGLAIVRRCVEAGEGELRFRNREGGGFEAEMVFTAAA